ncbi:hypothetical protein K435DRAFT_604125, partial [Dendrothele bispora CBS 962.96]
PMRTFVANRENYLAVQMILKGRGDHIPLTCPTCPPDREPLEPTYRCIDCFYTGLICQDCCVEDHRANPLHRIQVRVIVVLFVQLGHLDGSTCPSPVPGPSKMIVIHTNGIHRVRMNYCGC